MQPEQTPPLQPQPYNAGPTPAVPADYQPAAVEPSGSPKKKLFIVAGVVVGVLLVIGVLGWWQMGAAKSTYTKQTTAYEKSLKSAFIYYRDSHNVNDHVADISKHFNDALATKPKDPKVVFLSVAPKTADKQQVDKLTTSFTALRDAFKNLHDFNDYGEKAIGVLDTTSMVIRTPDDIRAAKVKFQTALTELKKLTPPPGMEAFQAEKVKAYEDLISDSTEAITDYDKGDATGYTTAVQKLAADASAANTNKAARQLSDKYNSYYADLAKKYDATATLLHVDG